MNEPNTTHMIAAKRILRYLSDKQKLCLEYKKLNQNNNEYEKKNMNKNIKNHKTILNIEGYCDADWGGDIDERKSTTGYCVYLNNNLICWNTHKQSTIALSTAEAELMSATDIVKEILWIKQILEELNYEIKTHNKNC